MLEEDEIDLLSKGLKYGVHNRNFNHFEILTRFEELAEKLVDEELRHDLKDDSTSTTPIDSFMQKLQFLTQEYINSSNVKQKSLTYDEKKTLNN